MTAVFQIVYVILHRPSCALSSTTCANLWQSWSIEIHVCQRSHHSIRVSVLVIHGEIFIMGNVFAVVSERWVVAIHDIVSVISHNISKFRKCGAAKHTCRIACNHIGHRFSYTYV